MAAILQFPNPPKKKFEKLRRMNPNLLTFLGVTILCVAIIAFSVISEKVAIYTRRQAFFKQLEQVNENLPETLEAYYKEQYKAADVDVSLDIDMSIDKAGMATRSELIYVTVDLRSKTAGDEFDNSTQEEQYDTLRKIGQLNYKSANFLEEDYPLVYAVLEEDGCVSGRYGLNRYDLIEDYEDWSSDWYVTLLTDEHTYKLNKVQSRFYIGELYGLYTVDGKRTAIPFPSSTDSSDSKSSGSSSSSSTSKRKSTASTSRSYSNYDWDDYGDEDDYDIEGFYENNKDYYDDYDDAYDDFEDWIEDEGD